MSEVTAILIGMDTATSPTPSPDQPERPALVRAKVVFDTPDLAATADFYTRLLGVEVIDTDDDWISLSAASTGLQLAFQLATEFTPPSWPAPDVPQQVHLDLHVDDLDAAERYALTLGARPVEGPDDSAGFRVFLDPVGHPFCFCQAS